MLDATAKGFGVISMLLLGIVASASGDASPAPVPTLSTLRTACAIGSERPAPTVDEASYQGRGATPVSIAGAVTVSPAQAKCVIDRYAQAVLVADAAGGYVLPDSLDVSWAATPYQPADERQTELVRLIEKIAGSARAKPILVYCHHDRCQLSYYVVQRLVKAGYTSVLWLRAGQDGWLAAGYPQADGSRWRTPTTDAFRRWMTCVDGQPLPKNVAADQAGPTSDRYLGACLQQEATFREEALKYQPAVRATAEADQARRLLAQQVGSRLANEREGRETAAKEAQEQKRKDDEALAWRRKQGFGLSPDQSMPVYEFCWAREDARDFHVIAWHYTLPVASRIERMSDDELASFNRRTNLLSSEHSDAFARYIHARTGNGIASGCRSFRTRQEALDARAESIKYHRDHRETARIVDQDWQYSG